MHVNKHGDITIIKGNKQFRMDVKDPGWKFDKNGKKVKDEPHFHLKRLNKEGKWEDATSTHRHYFKKGKDKK